MEAKLSEKVVVKPNTSKQSSLNSSNTTLEVEERKTEFCNLG